MNTTLRNQSGFKRKVFGKARNTANDFSRRALKKGVQSEDLTLVINNILLNNHKCAYCGRILWDLGEKTIDHKLAMSLGGTNTKDNVVLACYDCNHKKSILEQQVLLARMEVI